MPSGQGEAQDVSAFLRAVRNPGRDLRDRFKDDPIGLAERLGLILPPKPRHIMTELGLYDPEEEGPIEPGLRDLVEEVCTLQITDAVAVGPRGGGKSQGVSFIEFFLWMLHDFDALNLGGSELQADQVYQYLLGYLDHDPFWMKLIKGQTMREKTFTVEDSWVRVLTASPKSVRSPHAGGFRKGKVRGGLLVIDEEAEAEADIVEAALPTIDTARPSVNVRCSTFHNIEGSFADLVDDHVEMGYKLFRWDIFDVCQACDCIDVCQSPEPCFREDHYEEVADEEGNVQRDLKHKAYCGGRARYGKGWIPIEEIHKLWRRFRRNHDRWEVEAMGGRPSTKGHVIKDLSRFAQNIVTESGDELYLRGAPVSICVDWGTVAAGIEVWQQHPFGKHALLECEQVEEAGQTAIFTEILTRADRYRNELVEVAADIGGGGNYLNPKLREEHSLPVRDVNFQEEKEVSVAVWNIFNEANDLLIPDEFGDFISQVRRWKRKNGRIQKGNDHLCDTGVCYFSRFADDMNIRKPSVPPRSFSTSGAVTTSSSVKSSVPHRRGPRVPVVARPIGSRKK